MKHSRFILVSPLVAAPLSTVNLNDWLLGDACCPWQVRSTLRKCSSLAMEIPSSDLSALMATLDRFVMGPSSMSALQEGRSVARSHGGDRFPREVEDRGAGRRRYSDVDDEDEEEEEEDSTSPSSSGSSVASSFSVPSSVTDPEGEDDDDDSEDGMAR